MVAPGARPAVFLDRDGTLIEDSGYLSSPDQVHLLDGVPAALAALERLGFLRIVITNQSGIGRGLFSPAAFEAVQREVERQLAEAGASIDAVYCCPHAPKAGCPCRKPGTALHREAAATHNIDLSRSWYIGDHLRDIEPAATLGGRGLLVLTGQGGAHEAAATAAGVPVARDLEAGVTALSRYL